MFFEGSEKKFELHTTSSQPSLRKLGNPFFEQMVKKSEATILSKISNEKCDAYLLSESSLFVYDHKLLMITCGCTILIRSLLEVLKKIPLEGIGFLSFERKDENFPQLQYTSFEEDLQVLKKHVPGDNIYLGDKKGRHIALFYTDKPYSPPTEDLTIEVLMNGLGKESFFSQNHSFRSAQELRQKSGLDTIVPGFTIDDYLFQPQGYSLNAIKGLWYYSIHITPQNPGSYVSFETNYPFGINTTLSSTEAMLNKLFSIFAPQRLQPPLLPQKSAPQSNPPQKL